MLLPDSAAGKMKVFSCTKDEVCRAEDSLLFVFVPEVALSLATATGLDCNVIVAFPASPCRSIGLLLIRSFQP